MSFLGLYRDPVVATVTSCCEWRISDLLEGDRPVSLYFVIPPSDISRTKPLIRLILNQIGRRLTEDLSDREGRRRLLLMLDEFPALGRLDLFESALAFMAGYGIKAFLIAQSLNQIDKAYGQNNSILDNCHVRVSFATNDERTAKRVSDGLGVATEIRSQKNYAGHRLSPWLGHLMVSRQESARPLMTVSSSSVDSWPYCSFCNKFFLGYFGARQDSGCLQRAVERDCVRAAFITTVNNTALSPFQDIPSIKESFPCPKGHMTILRQEAAV